jgi:hypothetical protein
MRRGRPGAGTSTSALLFRVVSLVFRHLHAEHCGGIALGLHREHQLHRRAIDGQGRIPHLEQAAALQQPHLRPARCAMSHDSGRDIHETGIHGGGASRHAAQLAVVLDLRGSHAHGHDGYTRRRTRDRVLQRHQSAPVGDEHNPGEIPVAIAVARGGKRTGQIGGAGSCRQRSDVRALHPVTGLEHFHGEAAR